MFFFVKRISRQHSLRAHALEQFEARYTEPRVSRNIIMGNSSSTSTVSAPISTTQSTPSSGVNYLNLVPAACLLVDLDAVIRSGDCFFPLQL